jgi:D-lactate dehydrogenase
MRVLASDSFPDPEFAEQSGVGYSELDAVLAESDVLARLLTFPNVLITSHQAYLTTDALNAIAGTTVENIRRYFPGERGAEINEVVP